MCWSARGASCFRASCAGPLGVSTEPPVQGCWCLAGVPPLSCAACPVQDRQQRQEQPGADANGHEAGGDVEARIAAAVSEARSAAEAEAGEEMEDLLACLGA